MPRPRSKRSRKSFEHYRRRRVADLRHLYRCCSSGVLPEVNCEYLKEVLAAENDLPSPEVIAERVRFTNADRERHRLWTIPPIDMSKEQLAEQRKRKDRERRMIARRKAGAQLRDAYLAMFSKPWITAGVSRATWYRRKAKGETGPSGQQNGGDETRSSGQQNGSETGPSAPTLYIEGTTRLTHHQAAPPQSALAPLKRFLRCTPAPLPPSEAAQGPSGGSVAQAPVTERQRPTPLSALAMPKTRKHEP